MYIYTEGTLPSFGGSDCDRPAAAGFGPCESVCGKTLETRLISKQGSLRNPRCGVSPGPRFGGRLAHQEQQRGRSRVSAGATATDPPLLLGGRLFQQFEDSRNGIPAALGEAKP